MLLALTRRADVLSGLTRFHADPGIRNDTPLARWKTEDGIQIQFLDLRNVFDQPRNPKQNFFDSWNIGRRVAAIALQQTIPADFPNHFARILV